MTPPPVLPPDTCQRCHPVTRLHCQRGLLRLYDYWNAKRGNRTFPARTDLDPLEIGADLLPHVFLIDVLPDRPHFRFRLTGTRVDEIYGQPLTGKSPRDIGTPEIAQEAERQCARVVRNRAPDCDHVTLLAEDRSYWHFERLMLPLSEDGVAISMLFCGIYAT